MKTKEFLNVLEKHKDKSLLFEYAPDKFVGANYHITEIKHLKIDSVDCGGKTDAWNETIVQLWESPKEIGKRDYMKVGKAIDIFNLVGTLKPYDYNAEVKIEYSNDSFNTAQLYINNYEINGDSLIVNLSIERTRCKANDICEIPAVKNEITNSQSCNTIESNCC